MTQLALPVEEFPVFRFEYELDVWTDPWGGTHAGYRLVDHAWLHIIGQREYYPEYSNVSRNGYKYMDRDGDEWYDERGLYTRFCGGRNYHKHAPDAKPVVDGARRPIYDLQEYISNYMD